MLSPLDRPRCVTTGDLRRDPGLIVTSLAPGPLITVYWDGMPYDARVRTGRAPRPGPPGGHRPGQLSGKAMRVTATAEAAEFIRTHGGQLFVWPTEHRSARLALAFLQASVDPPPRALDFRRVEAGDFLLFIHPALKTLPQELVIVLRGRRHPHIEAYWDGLAYIAW